MTPERKEEIKWDYENTKSAIRNHIVPGHIKRIVVNTGELLAALEEAEQQVEDKQIELVECEEKYDTLQRSYEELDRSSGETLDLLKGTSRSLAEAQQEIERLKNLFDEDTKELIEAQQTIARQREVWQELKGIVSTNATGGKGEDINDYDIMLNIMGDLKGETQP